MTPITADETRANTRASRPLLALILSGTAYGIETVTQHVIENGQMKPGEYVELSSLYQTIGEILQGRGPMRASVEITPENVLINDMSFLVWYQPAKIAPCWFVVGNNERASLKIRWPAMLFALSKRGGQNSLHCVALGSDERPTAESTIYNLPFPNAYNGGGFCLGTAALPQVISLQSINEIEGCIYNALKTHSNNPNALKTGENPTAYWFRRSKEVKGKRPVTVRKADLYPIGKLRDLLNKLSR